MKKIILLIALFFSISNFAQKTVYIFNFSSYNVQIGEIQTKSTATSTYPRFKTNYSGTGGLISVPAGTTYTLTNPNNSFFPFYSPTSTPFINAWSRQFTSGASWVNFTSINLNNILALPQIFNFIKFQVGPSGNLGGGTIGITPLLDFVSGTGWEATYEPNGLGVGGAIITIYDI